MAYFTREQSIVGKGDLMKPFTFDENLLGYRPRYPEQEAKRARRCGGTPSTCRRGEEGPGPGRSLAAATAAKAGAGR